MYILDLSIDTNKYRSFDNITRQIYVFFNKQTLWTKTYECEPVFKHVEDADNILKIKNAGTLTQEQLIQIVSSLQFNYISELILEEKLLTAKTTNELNAIFAAIQAADNLKIVIADEKDVHTIYPLARFRNTITQASRLNKNMSDMLIIDKAKGMANTDAERKFLDLIANLPDEVALCQHFYNLKTGKTPQDDVSSFVEKCHTSLGRVPATRAEKIGKTVLAVAAGIVMAALTAAMGFAVIYGVAALLVPLAFLMTFLAAAVAAGEADAIGVVAAAGVVGVATTALVGYGLFKKDKLEKSIEQVANEHVQDSETVLEDILKDTSIDPYLI